MGHREKLAVSTCWPASRDLAFATLSAQRELRVGSVEAMIAAQRNDLAPIAVREFGAIVILRVLASKFQSAEIDRPTLSQWLAAALADRGAVAEFFAEQSDMSWALLSAIAARLPPDAVPNEYGVDPWVLAAGAAGRAETETVPPFLAAYLLSRALGWWSLNPGELVQLGFEPTHRATSANQLPREGWSILEPRLPWSWTWFDSDRCVRIRAAVGDLFVGRKLSAELFADLTDDDRLFAIVAETMARGHNGRHFLKRVQRWMHDSGQARYAERIKLVESLID